MKEKLLYLGWLCMYILCTGLGTLTGRNPVVSIAMTALGILFFLPGAVLVYDGLKSGNRKQLLRVRIISICSLVLTLALIVLTILLVGAGDTVGRVLNDLLLLVSTPMFCCHWRWLSLFLWACLLVSSFPQMWKK